MKYGRLLVVYHYVSIASVREFVGRQNVEFFYTVKTTLKNTEGDK